MRYCALTAFAVLLCSCDFSPSVFSDGTPGRADAGAGDGGLSDASELEVDGSPVPTVADVAHLPSSEWSGGEGDWSINYTLTINTTLLKADAPLPDGVTLSAASQSPAGLEVAVLRVGSLGIAGAGTLRAEGLRPLIIVADGDVTIEGVVSVKSETFRSRGAGGSPSQIGLGAGGTGQHQNPSRDSGGGGAGFSTEGARGGMVEVEGEATAWGGLGGSTYGDPAIPVLIGGSGGGLGSLCSEPGGSGGGAIQIFSSTHIEIAAGAAINAGGGGGGAGAICPLGGDLINIGGGSGGGSGGVIFLQAPAVTVDGFLSANGGGGGGGASADGNGEPGQNGHITNVALGGDGGGAGSSAGGAGSNGVALPETGVDSDLEAANAGGGGGAAGRIAVMTKPGGNQVNGTSSPPHAALNY